NLDSAFAARLELPERHAQLAGALVQAVILSVVDQLGFVIERIHVRTATGQVDEDHVFDPGRKVRLLRRERVVRAKLCGAPVRSQQLRDDGGHQDRTTEERAN